MAAGPMHQIGQPASGGVDKFPSVDFAAGDYAEIYVGAKGEAGLNLRVYDRNSQVVCADTAPRPIAYCGWTAGGGGAFMMQVENLGPQDTYYALMTN